MEFTCQTVYDQKSLTAMSKALRKTTRRRSAMLGWICRWMLLALLVVIMALNRDDLLSTVLNGAVLILLLFLQFGEDTLNAFVARRRLMPGMEQSSVVFQPDSYLCSIAGAETRWKYDKVLALVETERYIIFIMGKNQAQVYDKTALVGGSLEAFRDFLEEQTGNKILDIG